jgi:hypothetical protein
VWRNICAVRNVNDFKTVTSYRLIGKDQYELVAPGGELKHGTLGNEQYTNKADTYGLMLSIDRRDIINDDLGAITTVPRKLGTRLGPEDQRRLLDGVPRTTPRSSPSATRTSSRRSDTRARHRRPDGKAEVAFMDLVDSRRQAHRRAAGDLAGADGRCRRSARSSTRSLELRDTTAANTKFPVANPHQGKFRIEVSRYLGNASYTGQLGQGLVPAVGPERPAGDRGRRSSTAKKPRRSKRPTPTLTCSACRCGATTISALPCKTRAAA